NRGEGDYAWAMPHDHVSVSDVSVADATSWLELHAAFVLDVREPDEYSAGHVPCAVSVPQADLAMRLEEVPRDRDVLVVCQSGPPHRMPRRQYVRAIELQNFATCTLPSHCFVRESTCEARQSNVHLCRLQPAQPTRHYLQALELQRLRLLNVVIPPFSPRPAR